MENEQSPITNLSNLINRHDKELIFTGSFMSIGLASLIETSNPFPARLAMFTSAVVGTWINGINCCNTRNEIKILEHKIFNSFMDTGSWQK